MSEVTDLTVIEIKPEQAPALYIKGGLNGYLDQIRELAKEVPDVTTKKGRDRIGSLARMVGSSKTAIEKPGREYLKKLKEAVKPAEEELRVFTRECDAIRDEILKPRNEWEAEQERIKAEEEAKAAAEALRIQVENDHEIALLLNEKFDREVAEKAAEAERNRIAYEEEIKRQAAEAAAREVEMRAQREREEAANREAVLKAQAEQAERDRIAAEQKAEADKLAAIEAERRKAQEEAKRVANIEHCRGINQQAVADLVKAGVHEECAKKCVSAIAKSLVSNITIKY
ncbi:TPA: hypothetical protein QEG37_004912 [Pluralibacter gergoviae]|nr:hypothetical protein [Pluralibacter gergoviae]HDS1244319.1 hypothetical protein [Pluralibacter gergoviae]HDS1249762.1 hypothetical protein [Pluralibacter gergoviae]HDS1255188.1 hypothetical protein [Pluralibacter gergoviae]HDS1260801.1 hypothetical protein [Pluralibacter gergoviae]